MQCERKRTFCRRRHAGPCAWHCHGSQTASTVARPPLRLGRRTATPRRSCRGTRGACLRWTLPVLRSRKGDCAAPLAPLAARELAANRACSAPAQKRRTGGMRAAHYAVGAPAWLVTGSSNVHGGRAESWPRARGVSTRCCCHVRATGLCMHIRGVTCSIPHLAAPPTWRNELEALLRRADCVHHLVFGSPRRRCWGQHCATPAAQHAHDVTAPPQPPCVREIAAPSSRHVFARRSSPQTARAQRQRSNAARTASARRPVPRTRPRERQRGLWAHANGAHKATCASVRRLDACRQCRGRGARSRALTVQHARSRAWSCCWAAQASSRRCHESAV